MEVCLVLKVTQLLREDLERKKRYFKGAEAEIAEKNLRLIEVLSLVTAAILLTFFALTPVIIPGWTMTIQHFLMLPASLLLCAGAELGRRRKASPRAVTWMCLHPLCRCCAWLCLRCWSCLFGSVTA